MRPSRLPVPVAWRRLLSRGVLAWAAAVAFGTAPAAAEPDPFEVVIASPAANTPAFGRVRLVAEPRGVSAVARVEFFVGERRVGERTAPPWEIEIDVGESNAEKTFRVVATARDGRRAEATRVSPAVRVDLSMDLELQQLYVTVTRRGERVVDLGRDDFEVRDDGEKQAIVTFEHGDVPITAVLLVDSSQSMRGDSLRAALGGVRAFAEGMAALDEAALLLFSDHIVHRTPFSSGPGPLLAGLDQVEAEGGTALDDHLYLALQLLERRQGRRVVVLLSDGIDVESVLEMSQVLSSVRRSQALVYWLRLRDPASHAGAGHLSVWHGVAEHARELEQLERAVGDSGGRILDLARVEDAATAFREVLRELREQVVLGYYPSHTPGGRRWHEVEVKLPRVDGIDVRTRSGYFDY